MRKKQLLAIADIASYEHERACLELWRAFHRIDISLSKESRVAPVNAASVASTLLKARKTRVKLIGGNHE